MRCVVEPERSLRWYRLAIFATIAVAAAGCSVDSHRFDSNPFQAQAGASSGEVTGSVAQRRSTVQSKPLPAPPSTAAMQPPDTGPATTGGTASRRVAASAGRDGAAAPSGNIVHVIAPGETLMKLSRRYHKSLSEIAKANHIPAYTLVKVGDRIVIPGVRGSQAVAAKAPKPAPAPAAVAQKAPKPVPEQKMASVPPATTANVVTPAAHNPEPEKTKRDVTAAMPSFRWPVRGRVISAFGPRPSGQQNDGINVAVPEGTPIKAAEDGVVAYAGNELKSYGNLVLVRHANGYVTAYAHAGEILVKRDDPVKRGQMIAKSGQTGNVAAPQMHFEIRKGSTPVDPMPFLEKGGTG
jgi:murein DD-endopeptidase MepM/ murein hydrolase activator NlpD